METPHRDVASRLDQGMAAVQVIAEYVCASGILGYHHADLTEGTDDVHRWYESETGLNLTALESDRAALAAAFSIGEQVLRRQEDLLSELADAWQGGGGSSGRAFLVDHCAASEQVVTALRGAADSLAELGDTLWNAVDRKVQAAIDIEGRAAAQRTGWLAAARTVRTGVGDRDAACELVNQQVTPFVAVHIAGDWLTAMRASTATVADAYDTAVTSLRAVPAPVFGVPGQLGPEWVPSGRPGTPMNPLPTSSPGLSLASAPGPAPIPAVAQSIPSDVAPLALAAPQGLPPAAAAAPAPASLAGPAAGLPDPGTGMSELSGLSGAGRSGLSGLGQRLADMFGGLIGSPGEATSSEFAEPAVSGFDGAADGGPEKSDVVPETDEADESDSTDEVDEVDEDAESSQEPDTSEESDGSEVEDADEPATEDADPQPVAAPAGVLPPEVPAVASVARPTRTPCEIAADELPQVGG